MFQLITSLIRDEEAATALEYGMMAALIAAVIVATVKTLGTSTKTAFDTVSTALSGS